ncbi:MAG TPA: tol-pal system protein YbgF [Mesorhizobium sp.]
MRLKTLLSGALGVLMLGGAALAAGGASDAPEMSGGTLPGVFQRTVERPVLMAQAGDPAVQSLEEQVRALNGRVEELNFQILQMQEQMRKMQEDNEFRFQELEGGKKSDAGSEPNRQVTQAAPDGGPTAPKRPAAGGAAPAAPGAGAVASGADAGGEPMDQLPGVATPGADPALEATTKPFGTITFDENGNVVGGSVGDQANIGSDPKGAEPLAGADNTVVAALPKTDDPEELYRSSYEYILSGQYATAEAGFADHAQRFPGDVKAADARFWLGEAQLGQRKYNQAAETFLEASKAFPKSKKAPEMLLKLGVSLIGLNQRDVACATFAEIGKRYPSTSAALKERVSQEQAQASC